MYLSQCLFALDTIKMNQVIINKIIKNVLTLDLNNSKIRLEIAAK
ncbi:Uncharacterised protein [[Flavobacterium] thermophilum]|nr:Uncharacterised protein [[Flavobacterium] thermophilum]